MIPVAGSPRFGQRSLHRSRAPTLRSLCKVAWRRTMGRGFLKSMMRERHRIDVSRLAGVRRPAAKRANRRAPLAPHLQTSPRTWHPLSTDRAFLCRSRGTSLQAICERCRGIASNFPGELQLSRNVLERQRRSWRNPRVSTRHQRRCLRVVPIAFYGSVETATKMAAASVFPVSPRVTNATRPLILSDCKLIQDDALSRRQVNPQLSVKRRGNSAASRRVGGKGRAGGRCFVTLVVGSRARMALNRKLPDVINIF